MKHIFTILTGLMLVSTSVLAGGIASSSLSSVHPYENPAVQGFLEHEYEISAGLTVLPLNPAGSLTQTNSNFAATYDSLFFGASTDKAVVTVPGMTATFYDYSIINIGWAWDHLSVAAYERSVPYPIDPYKGGGFVWRIGSSIYLGFDQSSRPLGDTTENVGFSWKIAKKFRFETSSEKTDDGAGGIGNSKNTQIEYQWNNLVFGYYKWNEDTVNFQHYFITWEPEKGGLAASLGYITVDSAQYKDGTSLLLGYTF